MRGNDRQCDGVWDECHPNVTSETRIQSQFRGLFKTSPGTIRDAEENQHGGIVASTALEQMMRRSIETGLCEPWQPLAWMDFVVLEMDNTIGLEVLFATAIFSHKVNLQLPFIPSNPYRWPTNSYPMQANHPNPSYGNYPFSTHQNLSVPSIPPSPTNPFNFSAKHHTVTYKPFPLFEFPCSQHVITQRTFQFQI